MSATFVIPRKVLHITQPVRLGVRVGQLNINLGFSKCLVGHLEVYFTSSSCLPTRLAISMTLSKIGVVLSLDIGFYVQNEWRTGSQVNLKIHTDWVLNPQTVKLHFRPSLLAWKGSEQRRASWGTPGPSTASGWGHSATTREGNLI